MFSLIITIISIALVAALAVASVYYGGAAFSQGTAKAQASTLVAQAQQIAGANTLFANDHAGTRADNVAALVSEGYLASEPQANGNVVVDSWVADKATGMVTIDMADDAVEVAGQIDAQLGVSYSEGTPRPAAAPSTLQYGVIDADGEGDLQFFYKG